MENEVYIAGDYISGIAKRPDLVNQPCVLIYKEDGFVLSVLAGDKAESFNFAYDTIEKVTSCPRVIVEKKEMERKDPRIYSNLLAFGIYGMKGVEINTIAKISNEAFNNDIGKMVYNNYFEVAVEYNSPEGIRRLLLNVYQNPSVFVKYFDTIKK